MESKGMSEIEKKACEWLGDALYSTFRAIPPGATPVNLWLVTATAEPTALGISIGIGVVSMAEELGNEAEAMRDALRIELHRRVEDMVKRG